MLKKLLNLGISLDTSVLLLLLVMLIAALFQFGGSLLKKSLVVNQQLRNADALVVMAGSRSERLPAVADLFERGMAPKVLLANDGVCAAFSMKKQRNLYQVEWAEEDLVEFGVPIESIVKLPFYGSSTMFDVLAVKKYLVENDYSKIIVVTSDYHTRRSYWTFKHVLKEYPADITVFPVDSIKLGTRDIILEYVKLAYYVLRYGLLGLVPETKEVPLKK